jgi:hypothetical protein
MNRPNLRSNKKMQQTMQSKASKKRIEVGSAVKSGFWTMVDMASGRYLWRTLVAPPAKSESDRAH